MKFRQFKNYFFFTKNFLNFQILKLSKFWNNSPFPKKKFLTLNKRLQKISRCTFCHKIFFFFFSLMSFPHMPCVAAVYFFSTIFRAPFWNLIRATVSEHHLRQKMWCLLSKKRKKKEKNIFNAYKKKWQVVSIWILWRGCF